MEGTDFIKKEREEQKTKHHKDIRYDITMNSDRQLQRGARMLLVDNPIKLIEKPPMGWDLKVWKHLCELPTRERLIRIGALIAAEIDRLDFLPKT